MVAKGKGVRGGMEWEVGVSRHKLLYMEWINNKDLLHSTGDYIQYLVINCNVKYQKKNIYVYNQITLLITESLCCTPETNKTL